jgi:MFS family permease
MASKQARNDSERAQRFFTFTLFGTFVPLTRYDFIMNKVIKVLIYSDVSLITGLGFAAPIFAIFLTNNIEGGSIETAGFAAAIYWIFQAGLMIPFGKYLDKKHGEKDDLWFIVIGNFLAAAAVLGYIFSRLPWHIYLLQAIYGIGMGMNMPGYTAIFTRHIDKGKEAYDWSVRGALVGIGTGISGALGGIIAQNLGFEKLFIGSGFFILLSALLPIFISKQMRKKDEKMPGVTEFKIIQPPAPKE